LSGVGIPAKSVVNGMAEINSARSMPAPCSAMRPSREDEAYRLKNKNFIIVKNVASGDALIESQYKLLSTRRKPVWIDFKWSCL
jgi:hypothetical protein